MRQTLLLLEDVDGLGRSGDIVNVKPGFARNYLFPEKKGILASKQTIRLQDRLKEERAKRAIEDKNAAEELAKRLEGLVITMEVKVDPEGKMYGSVSSQDILSFLEKEGFTLERKFIQLKKHIKETGVFPISLKLKEGVPATITLKVVPEGGVAVLAPVVEVKE
jgi:large subunit ribosomal protein L9